MNWRHYKKLIAGIIGTLAALAATIPTDADPKLIALGGIASSLAVLLGPANDPKPKPDQPAADRLFGPRRPRRPFENHRSE